MGDREKTMTQISIEKPQGDATLRIRRDNTLFCVEDEVSPELSMIFAAIDEANQRVSL
jgi:hypothetical protein